jgi:hypothetical protein
MIVAVPVCYCIQMGMKAEALEKALWGDYFYDSKTKMVSKKVDRLQSPIPVCSRWLSASINDRFEVRE